MEQQLLDNLTMADTLLPASTAVAVAALATLLPSPSGSPAALVETANQTALGKLVDDFVRVLDEGPVAFDPRVAMTLAIATPLVLLVMCLMCLVCRGVPYTMCGGYCTYWKRMPKEDTGLTPDGAIGEHQDELCETDSMDEDSRTGMPLPEEEEVDEGGEQLREVELRECNGNANGHRECCSKMAAALDAGALDDVKHSNGSTAVVTSPPESRSTTAIAAADIVKRRNGKAILPPV